MKMSPLKQLTAFICAVVIFEAAFGQEKIVEKFGVIGGEVSFGPESLTLPVSTIAWKQNSSGSVVKAIEWDGDEPDVKNRFSVLNPRFQGITTLDEKTGRITIKNVNADHAGIYIFEINSKEQGHKIKLGFMSPVPKPEIIKIQANKDTVYLECRYSDTIIWKNSTGQTLEGSPIQPRGESLTVQNTGNPENFYTCTLKNAASESTSDRVYERDLFSSESNAGLTAGIIILIIILLLLLITFIVYQRYKSFRDSVNAFCPCTETALSSVTCFRNEGPKSTGGTEDLNISKDNNHPVNKPLLEGEGPEKVAEGQKNSGGNPGSDTSENATYGAEGAAVLRSGLESNDNVAEGPNNAGGNQDPETEKPKPDNGQKNSGGNPGSDTSENATYDQNDAGGNRGPDMPKKEPDNENDSL